MAEKMIVDDGAMVMEPKDRLLYYQAEELSIGRMLTAKPNLKVTDKMEINCQMEELKRQLLASQQKVEELTKENGTNQQKMQELTKENGNLQQKVEELAKENEQQKQDFEGRIAQLQQEKEEIHKELGKKLAEEEDKQIMLPMHEMIQLPLENWYDLLAFVPRRQLVNIASQIWDRQFARILQSFLHEHGDITLGQMEIYRPQWNFPSDRTMATVAWSHYLDHDAFKVDLPDWPMPKNVKSFDGILLNYVNMPVLDFLRKFQENSLLTNVQLDFDYEERDQMLPILKKILPLISSIYSIHFFDLFNWVYNYNDKETQVLLKTMVAQTRILSFEWYNSHGSNCICEKEIDWCCSWLYTPRDDGMPRTLISEYTISEPHCSAFIDRIKKDFEEANQAVSFFICLSVPVNFERQISLHNNKTSEKLEAKAEAGFYDKQRLLISRHSSKAAKRKIEEDEKEIFWNGRVIGELKEFV